MIKGGTILVREQEDLSNLLLKTSVVDNTNLQAWFEEKIFFIS
jgi:hypothetical protein